MFAWMRKGYGNPVGVSFWLGLHFLGPAQFLAELVHPYERNQLRPSTPRATVWIILQTFPFNCAASYLFAWPNSNVSLMLACLGTPDLITVLFFSVSWQTIYYENENAISSLSPINLLRTYFSMSKALWEGPDCEKLKSTCDNLGAV